VKKPFFKVYGNRFSKTGKIVGKKLIAVCVFACDADNIRNRHQGAVKGRVWVEEVR